MEIKTFENKRWSSKNATLDFRHKAVKNMVGSGRVLDLGCGDGFLMDYIKDKAEEVVGFDISEKAIAKCRAKELNASLLDFTQEPIPYTDGHFETVIMLDVLEHLYDPSTILREAVRVSSKFLIVSVPNFNSVPARLQVILGKVPENNTPGKGHIYWFNFKSLQKILRENHLQVVESHNNSVWKRVPLLGSVLELLAQKHPSVFALNFLYKIKK